MKELFSTPPKDWTPEQVKEMAARLDPIVQRLREARGNLYKKEKKDANTVSLLNPTNDRKKRKRKTKKPEDDNNAPQA